MDANHAVFAHADGKRVEQAHFLDWRRGSRRGLRHEFVLDQALAERRGPISRPSCSSTTRTKVAALVSPVEHRRPAEGRHARNIREREERRARLAARARAAHGATARSRTLIFRVHACVEIKFTARSFAASTASRHRRVHTRVSRQAWVHLFPFREAHALPHGIYRSGSTTTRRRSCAIGANGSWPCERRAAPPTSPTSPPPTAYRGPY